MLNCAVAVRGELALGEEGWLEEGKQGLLVNSHGWPKVHTYRCGLVTPPTKVVSSSRIQQIGCGLQRGGWLARHSTIKEMGPPHRLDV